MTPAEISLLAVVGGFVALVFWVYAPKRRNRLESYGAIPLEDGADDRDNARHRAPKGGRS
jgi:cbb3-type cytochrome oxidase subunit 3